MLSRAALRAVRPASAVARSTVMRTFSATSQAASGDSHAPKLYGPGAKPGEVPSIYEQATGLERLQLLGDIEGVSVFDDAPLDSSRVGTKAEPIVVPSLDAERIIGCTGAPADSHDVLWFPLLKDKQARCLECGSVYAMNFQGEEGAHAHH